MEKGNYIKVNGMLFYLDRRTQMSPTQRPFVFSSLEKVNDSAEWINRELRSNWAYGFKYLDDMGGCFYIEMDKFDLLHKIHKSEKFIDFNDLN